MVIVYYAAEDEQHNYLVNFKLAANDIISIFIKHHFKVQRHCTRHQLIQTRCIISKGNA